MSMTIGKAKAMTIKDHLQSPALRDQIAQVLPKHCDADRMARIALTAITRTPDLAKCDQPSFFRCLMDLSQWGLEPDGRHAHLIPFKNRKRDVIECQLILDYKGIVALAYRSGQVASIHADVICEEDDFAYDIGQVVRHRVDFRKPRGAVYAAYAIVKMHDGAIQCEVMTRDEIEQIRARSKSATSGPWVTDWNEMAKKTVFRRLSKWLPLSAEVYDAFAYEDEQPRPIEQKQPTLIPVAPITLPVEPEEPEEPKLVPAPGELLVLTRESVEFEFSQANSVADVQTLLGDLISTTVEDIHEMIREVAELRKSGVR